LLSGGLRTYIVSDEGREVTLFRVGKGETCVLSGSCLMDSIVFDVMIEAVEDTEVIIIPTSVLSQIMKENPGLKCICIKLPWNAFRMSCGQCSKFFYESGQKGCHFSVG